jgi:hypothetical protein
MLRRETPNRFSKTPFGPVSHHRPADPTGGRETDANLIRAVVATTSPLAAARKSARRLILRIETGI